MPEKSSEIKTKAGKSGESVKSHKIPVQTYKQALRGLFASGTSPSPFNLGENTRKGRRKTRIESRFIGVMS